MKKLWAPWRGEYVRSAKKVDGDCVFCELAKSKISSESLVLYKTKNSFVVMNKFPYSSGHIMVIPILHVDSFDSMSEAQYIDLSNLLKNSIRIVKEVYTPQACNIGMNLGKESGAGIYKHLHYHIVPRWNGDTNFMPILAETKVISEHMLCSYEKLLRGFSKL